MFVNKVQEQKVELLRAVFRNMYLKEKCEYLESECKMLAEHIISSQMTRAEKNEKYLEMKKELKRMRKLHEEKMAELAKSRELELGLAMILDDTKSSMFSSLSETKSIVEILNIKDEMINCLQEELVHSRLLEAEKWAQIKDLKRTKLDLENDKDMLTTIKPETIARLQDSLLQARLVENHYKDEFAKVKLHLSSMKQQVLEVPRTKEGGVILSLKGALWTDNSTKEQEKEAKDKIRRMEEEKAILLSMIPDLETKLLTLNSQISFKDEQRRQLQDELDRRMVKQRSDESLIQERRRQYESLQNTVSEKVYGIRNNAQGKNQDIDKLSSRLDEIGREEDVEEVFEEEDRTVKDLEEQISQLKEKIAQLTAETSNLPRISTSSAASS